METERRHGTFVGLIPVKILSALFFFRRLRSDPILGGDPLCFDFCVLCLFLPIQRHA